MKELIRSIETIINDRPDPLGVRRTTAEVVRHPQFVTIKEDALHKFADLIGDHILKGETLTQAQFGVQQVGPQRVFLQDVVNFCFWAPRGKKKWTVEYPKGIFRDGWDGLVACFDRAVEEGYSILDASYVQQVSDRDMELIFRPCNNIRMPLLAERGAFLREAGAVLNKKYKGKFSYAVGASDGKADSLAQHIIDSFSSFQDRSRLNNTFINFYKRAQICAYDISLLSGMQLTNIEYLTVFSDYKLPQVFRSHGVIEYTPELAQKVDSLELISRESREEVEIRAATIWVGELLASELGMPPALVDNIVWLMGTKEQQMKPYHRTMTTCY